MKKIFAVLVSLFFVASVFGVAQTMGNGGVGCSVSGPDCIQVGEEFEVRARSPYSRGGTEELIKFIGIIENPDGTDSIRYEALKVGTRKDLVRCADGGGSYDAVISENCSAKSYPMLFFMKILGFGKKK